MESPAFLLLAVGALVVGLVAGWLLTRSALNARWQARLASDATVAKAQLEKAEALAAARATHQIATLETELKGAVANHAANEARLNELVANTRRELKDTFQALAGEILEEKTKRFTATNHERLGELLKPFRERLVEFQQKFEQNHLTETTERRSLKDELKRLMELNQQVSQDAKNLTTALKGEAKSQGNWGEMILVRVLESAGLTAGREFLVQDNQAAPDGNRQQPDVVIVLPEGRRLVIDSKVSLTAFERWASAAADDEREVALEQHLLSLRKHITSLGDKDYPALYSIASLDFVLLFVPIEPAFLAAVQADPGLYESAWRKNIVIVSPTTLMATARVVESVWRLERQNRNVQKIAADAGSMYDAFVSFVNVLEKAAKQVHTASETVDEALKKLNSGKGNLVRRAENIRKLGAKTTKLLPEQLVENADDAPAEDETPAVVPAPDAGLRH